MCWTAEETIVKLSKPLSDDVITLSTIDQHALRIYSKFVIVFKTEGEDQIRDGIRALKRGLAKALCEHPDFATQIVQKPGSTRKELELRIGPESGVQLRTVDHSSRIDESQDCHELLRGRRYADLERGNFPLTDVPEELFFIPHADPEDFCPAGVPALLVQANVLDGAIILGISWHHSVSDACGMNTMCRAWAQATNIACTEGEAWNPDEPTTDNSFERWRLSYGTRATIAEFPEYVVEESARSPGPNSQHLLDRKFIAYEACKVSMWHFSAESMQSFTELLNSAGQGNEQRYTQVEAISALLWKHLSRARRLETSFPGGSSLFTTRVDYRSRMSPPLPQKFIGNINQPVPRVRLSLREVCAASTPQSLAELAGVIRKTVSESGDKEVRKLVGFIDSLPGVVDLDLNFNTCPGPDVAITDLSGLDLMRHEWGMHLGRPICIRGFVRYKGFAAFFPKMFEGGRQLHMQCEAAAVERLKADPVFTRYAQFLY
ncbi:hypothetical protein HIM_09537 [Hirsutella minnesotensis 3608]|uniref:Trichothecene 3-O-acetyltransferase n=1 Tax=Hirsutella minnesotensis 3608 TaxID=1043627 RepID=A0A0F7ZLC8_9HYPO|nr:hypothetical protein HIM_09537 [Hirsutella minnesotensis 3608]